RMHGRDAAMSAEIQIESACELDAAVCRHLILNSEPWLTLQYGDSDVQAIVRSAKSDHLLLARDGARVVGFALSASGVLLGEYLKILVVEGSYRSHGVGQRLMDGLEERAFRDWPNVYLCVSDFNEQARQFYRRRGYEEVGVLKDLLLPGIGEVLMRKSIAAWRRFQSQPAR
ncbi:MAG: GNAT family N-acetyltransferase, partial [Gaiellaceae bacterium]